MDEPLTAEELESEYQRWRSEAYRKVYERTVVTLEVGRGCAVVGCSPTHGHPHLCMVPVDGSGAYNHDLNDIRAATGVSVTARLCVWHRQLHMAGLLFVRAGGMEGCPRPADDQPYPGHGAAGGHARRRRGLRGGYDERPRR